MSLITILAPSRVGAVSAPFDSIRAEAPVDSVRVLRVAPPSGRAGRAADRYRVSRTLELMGSREVSGRTAWERRKNPKLAMLLSAVMPGMGQVYNGRRVKVAVAAGAFGFYASNTLLSKKRSDRFKAQRDKFDPASNQWNFYNGLQEFWKDDARTFLWWSGAAWLLILLDSWIDAHLYDIRAYTPPPVDESSTGSTAGYVTLNFDF